MILPKPLLPIEEGPILAAAIIITGHMDDGLAIIMDILTTASVIVLLRIRVHITPILLPIQILPILLIPTWALIILTIIRSLLTRFSLFILNIELQSPPLKRPLENILMKESVQEFS